MSYSWGDDSGSKTGGGLSRTVPQDDYASARAAYKAPSSRSTRTRRTVSTGKSPVGQVIKSDSKDLVVIRFDVTGSNETNAKIFFEKLPLLHQDGTRYLPDLQISFGAVGDANSDHYPLQIRDFKAGKALDGELNALFLEGNGGGQGMETYELAGLYDLKRCEIPKAVNPFYFLLCDEGYYKDINPDHVKEYIGIDLAEPMTADEVWKQLKQKFKVYILRCSCTHNYSEYTEIEVHKQWVKTFGADHVILMEDAARVVDCILGILAMETGKFDDYTQRLTTRQRPDQVKTVMKTLHLAATQRVGSGTGKSVTVRTDDQTKSSKKLI